MYYFADWLPDGENFSPAFPEGMSFLMLAETKGAPYALFECQHLEYEQHSEYVVCAPLELYDLLNAAKQYAPALVLAAREMEALEPISRDTFAQVFAERLRVFLHQQPFAPYFMARAIASETYYISAGTYYWIVGYEPARAHREVEWVSHDYIIYQDALADFDVDRAMLEERFLRNADSKGKRP